MIVFMYNTVYLYILIYTRVAGDDDDDDDDDAGIKKGQIICNSKKPCDFRIAKCTR